MHELLFFYSMPQPHFQRWCMYPLFSISMHHSNHFYTSFLLLWLHLSEKVMYESLFSASMHHIPPVPPSISSQSTQRPRGKVMQEPLFGAFLHHFSTTSRQAARIRGAPNPQQSLHPSTRANWIGAHRIRAAFRWKEMHEGAPRPFVHLFFSS